MADNYSDFDFMRRLDQEVEQEATRRINESIARIRQEYTPRVEAALSAGDYILVGVLGEQMAAQIGRAIADEFEKTYLAAARAAADSLGDGLLIEVGYSAVDPRGLNFINENTARLVAEITEEQRLTIQMALRDATERGINPRVAAKELVGSIGLSSRQQAAVMNYRRLLENNSSEALNRALRDPRFDAAVARGGLSRKQIDTMVDAYRNNYIRYRTENIARTEMLAAANQGVEDAYQQAIESGALDQHEWVREWWTARDERVRTSHRSMHGQIRGMKEKFRSGAGNLLQYPHDPSAPADERIQCRCRVMTRFKLIVEDEQRRTVLAEV